KAPVIQRGGLNYAGAHCPGKAWSCVSSFRHTIIQISKRGGQNRAVCRSSHCVVVQISGVSRGVYVSGRQLAATGGGASTASCVTQNIHLGGWNTTPSGTPTAANLQAHQSVTIKQDAIGSGANSAVNGATSVGGCDTTTTLGQSQALTSTITATGPITQNEDA